MMVGLVVSVTPIVKVNCLNGALIHCKTNPLLLKVGDYVNILSKKIHEIIASYTSEPPLITGYVLSIDDKKRQVQARTWFSQGTPIEYTVPEGEELPYLLGTFSFAPIIQDGAIRIGSIKSCSPFKGSDEPSDLRVDHESLTALAQAYGINVDYSQGSATSPLARAHELKPSDTLLHVEETLIAKETGLDEKALQTSEPFQTALHMGLKGILVTSEQSAAKMWPWLRKQLDDIKDWQLRRDIFVLYPTKPDIPPEALLNTHNTRFMDKTTFPELVAMHTLKNPLQMLPIGRATKRQVAPAQFQHYVLLIYSSTPNAEVQPVTVKTATNPPPGTFIAIEGKSKRETKHINAVRVLIPNSNDTLKTLMKDLPPSIRTAQTSHSMKRFYTAHVLYGDHKILGQMVANNSNTTQPLFMAPENDYLFNKDVYTIHTTTHVPCGVLANHFNVLQRPEWIMAVNSRHYRVAFPTTNTIPNLQAVLDTLTDINLSRDTALFTRVCNDRGQSLVVPTSEQPVLDAKSRPPNAQEDQASWVRVDGIPFGVPLAEAIEAVKTIIQDADTQDVREQTKGDAFSLFFRSQHKGVHYVQVFGTYLTFSDTPADKVPPQLVLGSISNEDFFQALVQSCLGPDPPQRA